MVLNGSGIVYRLICHLRLTFLIVKKLIRIPAFGISGCGWINEIRYVKHQHWAFYKPLGNCYLPLLLFLHAINC